VDDVGNVVAIREGEEGRSVGDVERLDGNPAGQEGRDLGSAVTGDDHLTAEVGERAGGVGTDHAEPTGNQDHVCLSAPEVSGRCWAAILAGVAYFRST
jgi:hypothetical protein